MTSKTTTEALPTSILGVRRTVTAQQSADYFAKGDVERVRGALGFRFLVARHKAESVRAIAEKMGISKSTADRANRAAEIVWNIGSKATQADAQAAITLVNAISAERLGKVSDYVAELKGDALQKALPKAQAKATADMAAARERKAKDAKASQDKTRTRTVEVKDDKSKVKAAAGLLTGVKDGSKADAEDVRTMLAQALRIAVESDLEASAIAHEFAFAIGDQATSLVGDVQADAAAGSEQAPQPVKPVEAKPGQKRTRKAPARRAA